MNPNIVKQLVKNANKNLKKNFDDRYNAFDDPELDKNAIPNIENLLDNVIKLVEFVNTDEMIQLQEKDPFRFENTVEAKFDKFADKHYRIFKLLIEKDNREEKLFRLIEMFTRLKKIKENKIDIEQENKKYIEELNEEFIYSKHGGKENFEKFMKQRSLEKNKKKK
jgi:hypothetical protein